MNEMSPPNIFRPFRAGHRMDVFLGLKPQAESYCPFGAETKCSTSLKVSAYGAETLGCDLLHSFNVLSIHSAVCEKTL
jgi:hypothetical protein